MAESDTFHMQVSLDVERWPDDMIAQLGLTQAGRKLTVQQARQGIKAMRAAGYTVLPCTCDAAPPGRCPGIDG